MVGENLEKNNQVSERETAWDGLSDGAFDKAQAGINVQEAQEQAEATKERQELEKATVDKINKSPKAKNIFKKIVLGALLSTVVIGGATVANHNLGSKHETTDTPAAGDSAYKAVVFLKEHGAFENVVTNKRLNIQKVAENTRQFIDIDSDDLVWMETVSNGAGKTIGLNEKNIDHVNSITGFEKVSSVRMDWWQGQGDMYRAIDTDGNGAWDTASRLNPYTNEYETIQLSKEDGSDAMTMREIQSQFDKA